MSDDGGGYDGGGCDSGYSYSCDDTPSYDAGPSSSTYDPEPSYETGRTSPSPANNDEPRYETGRSSPSPGNNDEPRYETGRSSPLRVDDSINIDIPDPSSGKIFNYQKNF